MYSRITLLIVIWGLLLAPLLAGEPALKVKVEYTGEGEVNEDHRIWVFIWDTSTFTGNTPIAYASVSANGESADFVPPGVSPVYITVAYDEPGGYAVMGPPPSGTPVSAYTGGGPGPGPVELKEGETVEVEISFDASFRLP